MRHWVSELDRLGWKEMLIDRLRFHGGLSVKEVSEETGRSMQTVRKHFKQLVESGKAKWGHNMSPDEIGAVWIEGVKRWQ